MPDERICNCLMIGAELDAYLSQVIDHDIGEQGHQTRSRAALRRWLWAYAAAVSSLTSYERIRDAANPGTLEKPDNGTVLTYRDALRDLGWSNPCRAGCRRKTSYEG